MAPTVVYSYDDSADVAENVAKLIIASQDAALSRNSKFTVAVSGGSLGKVLNQGLIKNKENMEKVKWEQWQVYFSDERMVPLDHEDSNYGLFNKMVLQPLLEQHRPEPHVFPIDEVLLTADGSKDGELAHEYEKKLPGSLDLILLGCGPDGHTCSLFPNHPLLKERGCRIAPISDSPKPPSRRITFTLPVLEAAKEICFVAEGEGKAPVLQQIFGTETSNLPCEIVNGLSVKTSWFTNTPAVNGVDVKLSKYNL